MPHADKARTIRLWLLMLAVFGAWLIYPRWELWSLAVPMFLFPNCTCCPTGCCTDVYPDQFQVDLSGFVDGTCANCAADLNTSFVLDRVGETCVWELAMSGYCETIGGSSRAIEFIRLGIVESSPGSGNFNISVQFINDTYGVAVGWTILNVGTPDCDSFSSEAVTVSALQFLFQFNGCSGGIPNDALVTAL